MVTLGGERLFPHPEADCYTPPDQPITQESKLSLTKDEVAHIGELAKLGLTEEQIAVFQEQLSEILDHFDALQELDTDDVEPMPYPLPLENVMREDEVKPSLTVEEVLANAPEAEEGAFKVEAVLEE